MIRNQRVLFFFALAWLTVVIGGYYVTHKPITPENALALLRAAGSLLVAGVWLTLMGALGTRLYPGDERPPLERLAVQLALGMGVWSVGVLLWGALVRVNGYWVGGMALLAGVLLRREVVAWWRNWAALPPLWRESGTLGRMLALGVGLIFLFMLPVALAPPLKFDALVYHLALPRDVLLAGKIVYRPDNVFWGMPQLAQMSYLLVMAVGGVPAAVALGWWIGLVAVVGVLGLVAARLGERAGAGWVAVAALLGGYSLAASLAWGYVDWHMILFGLAALATLLAWLESRAREMLWLAGLFAGFAIGVKYTAGVVLLGGVGLIFLEAGKRRLRDLGVYLGGAALAVSPWLLKNYLATGNPLYPFGFPAGAMTPLRLSLYQGQPIEGNWWDFFLLPLRATFFGVENATLVGRPGYNSSLGPLLLGLAPLALIWRGNPYRWTFVRRLGTVSLVGLVVWGLGGRLSGHLIRTHLYFVLFPAFAALAGAGFAALGQLRLPGVRAERLGGALILLALIFNVFQVGRVSLERGAWDVLIGLRSSEDYQVDNLGWYAVAMQSLTELPAGSRVVLLWEARSLGCLPVCDPDETLDRWMDDLRSLGDPAAVARTWREQGFTHVLYYRLGADFVRASDQRYQPGEWDVLDALLASLPVVENFGEAYTLYALETPP